MSNKANKMGKVIDENKEQVKTKSITYRLDVELSDVPGLRTTYMIVSGVPEDLPEEYEETVKRTAEAQFATALNQRLYLEFYSEGKTSKDETPVFYNMTKLKSIKIVNISKVEN